MSLFKKSVVGSDALLIASLVYLFLPSVLFFLGWMRLSVGLVLTIGVVFGIYKCLQPRTPTRPAFPLNKGFWPLLVTIAICAAAVYWSSAGSYTPNIGVRDPDKQYMTLREFMVQPWPCAYQDEVAFGTVDPQIPAYHFYYYMTAGAVGKIMGWKGANHFLAIWVCAGLCLSVFWIYRLIGSRNPTYALWFLLFGGLGVLAQAFLGVSRPLSASSFPDLWWTQASNLYPEMDTLLLHYPSNYLLLSWLPNHAIPGWLATGVLMHETIKRGTMRNAFFIASVVPVWSVFMAMGILPFLVALAVRQVCLRYKSVGLWPATKEILTVQNAIIGPLIVLVQALMLMSNNGSSESGFIVGPLLDVWPMLLLFYFISFGAYVLFLPRGAHSQGASRVWWVTALTLLFLIPIYKLGVVNDFCGRVCVPALFVLFVFVAKYFVEGRPGTQKRLLLTLAMIGTAPSAVVLYTNQQLSDSSLRVMPEEEVMTFAQYCMELKEDALQALGSPDSFFWRVLGKPLHVVREVPGPIVSETIFSPEEALAQWTLNSEPFGGQAEIDNASPGAAVELSMMNTHWRLDMLRRVRVEGALWLQTVEGVRKLEDVGVVRLSLRKDGESIYGPVVLKSSGDGAEGWAANIPAGVIPRSKSVQVVLQIELLRQGVHRLDISHIVFDIAEPQTLAMRDWSGYSGDSTAEGGKSP